MLKANLEFPGHVTTDAAHYLEAAKDTRLPGGWPGSRWRLVQCC